MSDLRINWIDEWEKKDVDLEELRRALESGDSARYSGKAFRDIGGKWKKYAKRGVSNLYLLKETEDDNDGLANAYYAYSITDGVIADEDLEQIRAVCAENLSTSEMRAVCSFCTMAVRSTIRSVLLGRLVWIVVDVWELRVLGSSWRDWSRSCMACSSRSSRASVASEYGATGAVRR